MPKQWKEEAPNNGNEVVSRHLEEGEKEKLLNAKDVLHRFTSNPQAIQELRPAEFLSISPTLAKELTDLFIPDELKLVEEAMKKLENLSATEARVSFEEAVGIFLHRTKKMADLLIILNRTDLLSEKLIRLTAIADECAGNYYMSFCKFRYLKDNQAMERTSALNAEYGSRTIENIELSKPSNLSDSEKEKRTEEKFRYIDENISSSARRLLDAAKELLELEKANPINTSKIIENCKDKISLILKA